MGYLLKLVRHADEVRKDLHHPVKISFFDGGATEPLLIAQWKTGLVVRNWVRNNFV